MNTTMKTPLTRKDIAYHGKTANGHYSFSCYGQGLGSYVYIGGGITAAWSAAIDYFNRRAM
jgi:hypothetical protein